MLKRNESFDGGLTIDGGQGVAVTDTVVTGLAKGWTLGLHLWNSWQEARLHRQTVLAVSELDDRTLTDIGWPWRYEQDHPSRRARR